VQVVAPMGGRTGTPEFCTRTSRRGWTRVGKVRTIVVVQAATPANFVREIPRRAIKVLDLVDVVAVATASPDGATGASIDHRASDRYGAQDPILSTTASIIAWRPLPFVDGVFVPDGRTATCRLTLRPQVRCVPSPLRDERLCSTAQVVHLTPS